MASAALTVIGGYPAQWYGGHVAVSLGADPTRVIQGVVTGIGFLGAGVIMKEGFTISGLTTAASLWASSAIGILVGIGFYAAAILLAVLCALCMAWVTRLEHWLP
jgi:putative Mg2+ transporter-C (MgtC) family protein